MRMAYRTRMGTKRATAFSSVFEAAFLALDNDYMIVTNNRRDFMREYANFDLHNGLIIIVPNVGRQSQIRLFSLALDAILDLGESVINKLVEVLEDGSIQIRRVLTKDSPENRGFFGEGVKVVVEVVVDPQRQIDHFDLNLGLSNGLFRYWTQIPTFSNQIINWVIRELLPSICMDTL